MREPALVVGAEVSSLLHVEQKLGPATETLLKHLDLALRWCLYHRLLPHSRSTVPAYRDILVQAF